MAELGFELKFHDSEINAISIVPRCATSVIEGQID